MRYSTFDRELLAIKLAVKHFRYVLQDRQFVVYTDHKQLITVLNSVNPDWSDRVFGAVDYLSRFSLTLEHISGKSNVVADNLSRMVSVVVEPPFLDPLDIYQAQRNCEDCKLARSSFNSLQLEIRIVDGNPILGDISGPKFWPYLPKSLRTSIMSSFHGLSHAGVKPTSESVKKLRLAWHESRHIRVCSRMFRLSI